MGRGPISKQITPLVKVSCETLTLCGINPPFGGAIPLFEAGCPRVTHPSAANPLPEGSFIARLACVKHAASVRPEPGSNSQFKSLIFINYIIDKICSLLFFDSQ